MKTTTRNTLGLGVVLLGALTLYLAALASGPDTDVSFVREVHSHVPATTLDAAMEKLINWPDWHFNLREAKAIDATGMEYPMKEQTLTAGTLLRLKMEPPTKQWKRFELQAQVSAYTPREMLQIEILQDSSGRLFKLLSGIQWRVELLPGQAPFQTLIRGTATARTASWRARIFAKLTPRVMMNQVFYPDLEKLSKLSQPKDVNPVPVTEQ